MSNTTDTSLRIDVEPTDVAAIVRLSGRLDIPLDQELLREFRTLLDEGHSRVVVECSGLDYLSSRGVSAFIAVLDNLRAAGGDLNLVGVGRDAGLVLDRLGVSKLIQRFPTIDEAVEAFDTPIEDFLSGEGLDLFIAATKGRIYHASGCSAVKRMKWARAFQSKREARDAGLKPCRRCC